MTDRKTTTRTPARRGRPTEPTGAVEHRQHPEIRLAHYYDLEAVDGLVAVAIRELETAGQPRAVNSGTYKASSPTPACAIPTLLRVVRVMLDGHRHGCDGLNHTVVLAAACQNEATIVGATDVDLA